MPDSVWWKLTKSRLRLVFRPAPEDFSGVREADKRFNEGFTLQPDADVEVLLEHAQAHFTAIEAGRKSIEEKAEKLIGMNLALAGALIAALKLQTIKPWQTWPALLCFLSAIIAASLSRRALTWNIPSDPWMLVADWRLKTRQAQFFLATSYGLAGLICRKQLSWRSAWHGCSLWVTVLGIALLLLLLR